MSRPIVLTISQIVRESPDAISLHFPQAKVHRIWYKAGQFLTLAVNIDGKKYYRAYSICTAPRLDDTLAVTIKRVKGGLVSNWLNDHALVGDRLEALRPAGRFYVENSVKEHRHLILFAAGSGITPIFSILRSTLFNEPHSRVSLVYANRGLEDVIFKEQLRHIQRIFPERFTLLHYLSQAQKNEEGVGERTGRITREIIPSLLQEIHQQPFPDQQYYVCGPEGYMEEVLLGFQAAGVSKDLVHQEHFAREDDLQPRLETDLFSRMVKIQQDAELHEILVPAGAGILEAALQQGISLPYSCRQGECSTCMLRLLQGEARMAKNHALTDDEVSRGYILSCQAHPLTDDVIVEG